MLESRQEGAVSYGKNGAISPFLVRLPRMLSASLFPRHPPYACEGLSCFRSPGTVSLSDQPLNLFLLEQWSYKKYPLLHVWKTGKEDHPHWASHGAVRCPFTLAHVGQLGDRDKQPAGAGGAGTSLPDLGQAEQHAWPQPLFSAASTWSFELVSAEAALHKPLLFSHYSHVPLLIT